MRRPKDIPTFDDIESISVSNTEQVYSEVWNKNGKAVHTVETWFPDCHAPTRTTLEERTDCECSDCNDMRDLIEREIDKWMAEGGPKFCGCKRNRKWCHACIEDGWQPAGGM